MSNASTPKTVLALIGYGPGPWELVLTASVLALSIWTMIRLPSFLSRLKWAGEHPKYSKVIELLAKPLIFGAITVGLGWQWRLPDGQIILIAASGIALFSINQIPRVLRSMRRGGVVFEQHSCNESANRPAADPLTHANQTIATDRPPEPKLVDSLIVWFAQGLGIGRVMSTAPGTWGSLLGLGWTGVLLDTGDAKFFLLGAVAATLASVWFCGQAERILQQKDPPSVVLDEIVAMPFCFFGMTILYAQRHPNQLLPPFSMLCSDGLLTLISVFALFRLFDIWKPWPVRQSQSLPGGWGVTVDDLLAALYVNLVSLPFLT